MSPQAVRTVLGLTCVAMALGVARGAEIDGAGPTGALLQVRGSDGAPIFYGTTTHGGGLDRGTVFRLTARGEERVVHAFAGGRADGATPIGALIQGHDGLLYGVTSAGGVCRSRDAADTAMGCGSLFRLSPDGTETLIHAFSGSIEPAGDLLQAADGSFYGVGADQVFRIAPDGTETVLHQFNGGRTDGTNPSSLIRAMDGYLYGTTQSGGEFNHGTVFVVRPDGSERLIYSFRGGADGEFPSAPLIQGRDGAFYGTTTYGGLGVETATSCDRGCGTVFRVTDDGHETVLHAFRGGIFDGAHPATALLQTRDGDFVGTTSGGGSDLEIGAGTVYRIAASGRETMLYAFRDEADGVFPSALIQGEDGNLYGTAGGGRAGRGVVFRINPAGRAKVLYSFRGER